MTSLIYVALGGALGASARFGVGKAVASIGTSWPYGTFAANMAGSFAIGFILAAFLSNAAADSPLRLFLIVGFLGGFTTFSSYALEIVQQLQRGDMGVALLYALSSVLLGLLAVLAGLWFGAMVGRTM